MQIDNPSSQFLKPTSSSSSSHAQYVVPSQPVSKRGWRSLGRIDSGSPSHPSLATTTLTLSTAGAERRGLIRGRGEMERFGRMDLPGRPVESILLHLYDAFRSFDSAFANGYNNEHCLRDGFYKEDDLCGRTVWSTITFAKKLEAFAGLSLCWDLAVRALPFWEKEYAMWICGDNRYEIPNINPVLHLSWIPPQGISRSCNVCSYLYHTFKILPAPWTESTRYYTLRTTDLERLIVCTKHSAPNVCGKCLMVEDVEHDPNTTVSQMRDPAAWGDALCICRGCRWVAVEKLVNKDGQQDTRDIKTRLKNLEDTYFFQPDLKLYIYDGKGTIRDVLAALDRERWIMERSGIQNKYQHWLKHLEQSQKNATRRKLIDAVNNGRYSLERAQQLMTQEMKRLEKNGPTYSNEQYARMQNDHLHYWVDDQVMSGYWFTVVDQASRPYEPLWKVQCCVDDFKHDDKYFDNTLFYHDYQVGMLNDMPATMYSEMTNLFVSDLDGVVTPYLKCVQRIFEKIAQPHYEVAKAKAKSMAAEELLDWVRDPRSIMIDWSGVVKPFDYPPIISDTEQKVAEAATRNLSTLKRKRQRANGEVEVEIAGEQGSRPVLGIGGIGRDTRVLGEPCAVVPEDDQISPYFNSKRRATSLAPRASASPGSEGNVEDLAGTRRSSADSMTNGNLSDSMQATTTTAATVVSPSYGPGGIPPTPSLTADYTEASTPTHSRMSCSNEPPSPTIRPTIPPLNELPRSYIAAMVETIPWPKPSLALSPEDWRTFELEDCDFRANTPWLPVPESPVSAAVYSVIASIWANLWEDDDVCNCRICMRQVGTSSWPSLQSQLTRHLQDVGHHLRQWASQDDYELSATGDEATDQTNSSLDPDEYDGDFDDEEDLQDFNEER